MGTPDEATKRDRKTEKTTNTLEALQEKINQIPDDASDDEQWRQLHEALLDFKPPQNKTMRAEPKEPRKPKYDRSSSAVRLPENPGRCEDRGMYVPMHRRRVLTAALGKK